MLTIILTTVGIIVMLAVAHQFGIISEDDMDFAASVLAVCNIVIGFGFIMIYFGVLHLICGLIMFKILIDILKKHSIIKTCPIGGRRHNLIVIRPKHRYCSECGNMLVNGIIKLIQ